MKDQLVLQLYYTSCRRGLSGYAGFQTRAESDGVRPDERREIEAKALYQPPRDLPREPDLETIAGQFPKAFRTFKLSSGRQALVRAVYGGQDYSGRWGNYFAHALILTADLDGLWPIDAYAWPGWVGGLAAGSDEHDPVALLPVELADVVAVREDFSFGELKTFLGEAAGRPQALAKMLRAVLRRQADSRSLVIRERLELDGVYWTACIQKAFPPSCQTDLSSSTFQFDPRSSLAVNLTIGETDFLFDEAERKYQFYVFDFATGEHSHVPDDNAEYADVLSAWMASDPRRIEAFHLFAALFDYRELGAELLQLLQLYRLTTPEHGQVTARELHSMLAFASKYARPEAFPVVLPAVGDVTDILSPTASAEDWALILRFLADGAAATADPTHRRRAARSWVAAFDAVVVGQRPGEDVVLQLRREIERTLGPHQGVVSEEFLSKAHFEWLRKRAARLPARALGLIVNEVDRSSRHLGRAESYASEEVKGLLEAVLGDSPGAPPDLQWAFSLYGSRLDGLEAIAGHVIDVLKKQVRGQAMSLEQASPACRAVGKSLAGVLAGAGEATRFALINRLKASEDQANLLLGEWEESIARATAKIEAHFHYSRNVLADDSKFAGEMVNRMGAALLKVLPPDSAKLQARIWTESGAVRRFSDALAGTVLGLASQSVKLSPEDRGSEQLAKHIAAELAGRQRVVLQPDRLALRAAACQLLSDAPGSSGPRALLNKCDAASCSEFLGVVLPALVSAATSVAAHRRVLLRLAVEAHFRVFADVYLGLLSARPRDGFEEQDVAALVFWLRLAETDTAWPLLGELQEPALEVLAGRLRSLRKGACAAIRARVEAQLDLRTPPGRQAWESFCARLDAKKASLLGRLFGRGNARQ